MPWGSDTSYHLNVRCEKTEIKRLAADLGFARCGVCEAAPSDYQQHVRGWLAAGRHGEMDWLARNVETRLDPRTLVEGARSIIVVADALPLMSDVAADTSHIGHRTAMGRIARYAHVTDYHKVMKKRLFRLADALRVDHPDETFRVCVDTAPILEREHAQRAGIGWTGKHTLNLNRDLGSHYLLGEIVTTLAIPPDEPAADGCGTCTRCLEACPTGAITPHAVDATRCISYLTIEHRSTIDPKWHEAMGDWIYGCDICQDVCPFVRRAECATSPSPPEGEGWAEGARARSPNDASTAPNPNDSSSPGPSLQGKGGACGEDLPPGYDAKPTALPLLEILNWTEADRRAAFQGSAMKRAKLAMMKRNALIAAGNHLRRRADGRLFEAAQRLAEDADEPSMVRQTAESVLSRLGEDVDTPARDR